MLGVELAVGVRDLAHEDGARPPRRAAGRRAARAGTGRPPPRRGRGRAGRRARVQATPTSTSSSDSSERGSKPGTSAAHHRGALRRPSAPSARRGRGSARAGSSRRAGRARSVGLKPTIAAARGRDPDRPAGVRAERCVGEPGGERGRRPAARPAGDPARARSGSGRSRSAGSPRSSRRRTRAGWSCRRSRTRPPRAAARPRRSRVGTWSAKIAEPYVVRQPGGVEEVLDGEGDAVTRRLGPRQEDAAEAASVGQSTAR